MSDTILPVEAEAVSEEAGTIEALPADPTIKDVLASIDSVKRVVIEELDAANAAIIHLSAAHSELKKRIKLLELGW